MSGITGSYRNHAFLTISPPPNSSGSRIPRGRYTRTQPQVIQPRSRGSDAMHNPNSNLPWPKSYCQQPRSECAEKSGVLDTPSTRPLLPIGPITNAEMPEPAVTRISLSEASSLDGMSGVSSTSIDIDCSTITSTSDVSCDSSDLSNVTSNHILGREMMQNAMNVLHQTVDMSPPHSFDAGEIGADTNRKVHELYQKWVKEERWSLDAEILELREANRIALGKLAIQKSETQELKDILHRRDCEYNRKWAKHEANLKAETERCRQQRAIAVAQNDQLIYTGRTLIGLAIAMGGLVTFTHLNRLCS